ncbi:glycoside hydrolase family 6 protein [Nocardioides sp. Arc9.136]|uniref:glycoside hydrolase family 6 protein n=1 Tax=Nocardioides sp. Arc9.136 TaxID=2996826 RepID=UPI002665D1A5|nr:glycoside hydrolase family 6 protein [Nocardioides sp. Arc9.136]WKN50398.1 glycoside hydrolase family 6 protein [Nocardioides sp. Arc9.136]
MSPRLPLLPALVVAFLLLLGPATSAGSLAAPLPASPAAVGTGSDNPLAGGTWGVYRGGAEMAWAPYERATGRQRELLGQIANAPKAKWFGDWIPDRDIAARVGEYVANAQGGDPDALVQLTVFRMVPWEHEACTRLPTKSEKASYKRWVRSFAGALGDTRAAVVLQPDGPFALCAPRGSTQLSRLVAYAARALAALPRTSVYIEVGSAGWNHLDPQLAVTQLVRAGVRHVRGFHLNTTHYETTARQVRFGARVVEALAARGIAGRHFTVDTAQNGRGFTFEYNRRHHGGRFDNAPTCTTRKQRRCVTLGIPPTWQVADERWGMPDDVRRLAAAHVDGYLWAGRPWLDRQAKPFDLRRALAVARTTPYR